MTDSIQKVRTRFAPSPTGDLHPGSARTALFNWLFARHHGGEYLLRIEDTDRKRSTPEALDTILNGLSWLGIEHDGSIISQFKQADRHREIAQKLLDEGKAYYCYSSPEDLQKMRDLAKIKGHPISYDNHWRNRDSSEAPHGQKPTVRLKSQQKGITTLVDLVQGHVEIKNAQLDDMILLRSDGTPTYMLAVVVDDHDMNITHVIRGDDHLTNTFRQLQIYKALGWKTPQFAHIPLIHGPDGTKFSKRHGSTSVGGYANMGIMPKAMTNYLLRLGWSHGDDEIISTNQAIEWFNINSIGKSPARFDIVKLLSLNSHYIREASSIELVQAIKPILEKKHKKSLSEKDIDTLIKGMTGLKDRAKTLLDLAENAWFYVAPLPLWYDEKAQKFLQKESIESLKIFILYLSENNILWSHDSLLAAARIFVEKNNIKMRYFSQTLRAALTGSTVSPSIFEVMEVLGKELSLQRFNLENIPA